MIRDVKDYLYLALTELIKFKSSASNGDKARRWAIAITEIEKLIAWVDYCLDHDPGEPNEK